jgi:adenylate cyclase
VEALAIELTNDEQQRLDKSREVDPQAYDMLLKGLESFRRFTGETNEEARAYFLKAIEFDPSFARAYADVALTHAVDVQFDGLILRLKSLQWFVDTRRRR